MKARHLLFAVATVALCRPSWAADNSQLIVGSWYGVGQPGYPNMMWVARFERDGVMKLTTRLCVADRAMDELYAGRWKVTGAQEFIIFDPVEGFQQQDTYDIVFEDGPILKETMTASNRASSIGYVWRSKKVADTFELPGCNGVS